MRALGAVELVRLRVGGCLLGGGEGVWVADALGLYVRRGMKDGGKGGGDGGRGRTLVLRYFVACMPCQTFTSGVLAAARST